MGDILPAGSVRDAAGRLTLDWLPIYRECALSPWNTHRMTHCTNINPQKACVCMSPLPALLKVTQLECKFSCCKCASPKAGASGTIMVAVKLRSCHSLPMTSPSDGRWRM
jgi:hypothetical protein